MHSNQFRLVAHLQSKPFFIHHFLLFSLNLFWKFQFVRVFLSLYNSLQISRKSKGFFFRLCRKKINNSAIHFHIFFETAYSFFPYLFWEGKCWFNEYFLFDFYRALSKLKSVLQKKTKWIKTFFTRPFFILRVPTRTTFFITLLFDVQSCIYLTSIFSCNSGVSLNEFALLRKNERWRAIKFLFIFKDWNGLSIRRRK